MASPTRSDAEGTGARVLVVDDEPSITDTIATALSYEGFVVETAADGRSAVQLIDEFRPDLVILDVMLPDVDGISIARRLRFSHVETPILFVTARDSPSDRVEGLTAGADDYVTKPFTLAEVIARVHAILRRTYGASSAATSRFQFADLELDVDTHEVRRAGESLRLTATEFNLLCFFMENPRLVLSKSQILDHVWHYDFDGDPNVVETYISYLRRKLDAHGPPLIHTIRLVGYTLRESDG
jgi:Response regulators consisting of a CheY-like receiver domain and a winged-helix DNA-binding domain